MNHKNYLLLYLAALFVYFAPSYFQTFPGYMDADYYYSGGQQLIRGSGFRDQIIWNYLNDPVGIPQPSHAYWMPLVSIISAVFMAASGPADFEHVQLGFILLSAFIPVLTARLAYSFSGKKSDSLFAGLLAVFPGFYLAYLPTSDSFGISMIFGLMLVIALAKVTQSAPLRSNILIAGLAGIAGGLLHLARSEGLVWIIVGASWLGWQLGLLRSARAPGQRYRAAVVLGSFILGYLLVMAPWMLRNLQVFGSLLAPGGTKGLWLVSYNELFSYPADLLTFKHWLNQGLQAIIMSRWEALATNLQSTLAVQGQVLLTPFILSGIWNLRYQKTVQLGCMIWLSLFGLMSFVFPQIGARGGFFHAAAGVQILAWAVVPIGFHQFLELGKRKRGWNYSQASLVFRVGCVILVMLITLLISWQRVVGGDLENPTWNASSSHYREVETVLNSYRVPAQAVVMVNNPPGYFVATERPGIVIPHGRLAVVRKAASRYGAQFLILEDTYSTGVLADVYANPANAEGLLYLAEIKGTKIFMFSETGEQ